MQLRVARHTDDLNKAISFYVDILGLENLGSFQNHNDYDGIFIGKSNDNWHLEFTCSNEPPQHNFDEDDIIALYPESKKAYDQILESLNKNNIKTYTAKNPYWNENGILVKDYDGFNVIISNLRIKQ
jgi:catechol 2,3-dioxygenase-like lactoylglutathione lyase family enzyme